MAAVYLAAAIYTSIPTPVAVAEWSPQRPFAQQAADRGTPVVLRGTAAHQWKAMRWTPQSLAARGGDRVLPVGCLYSSTMPKMGPYWAAHRPLAKFASVVHRRRASSAYNDSAVATWRSFFGVGGDNPSTLHYYLSAELHRLDSEGARDASALEPSLESELRPYEEFLSLAPHKTSINVWAGRGGLNTPCHYDAYHNFVVMLFGRKRFDLWSPGIAHFPSLHPHHAQCLFSAERAAAAEAEEGLEERDGERVCSIDGAQGAAAEQSVELAPGDVLYLPPLWSHDVTVTSAFALSVNFWTETRETTLAAALWQARAPPLPAPLANAWHVQVRCSFLCLLRILLFAHSSSSHTLAESVECALPLRGAWRDFDQRERASVRSCAIRELSFMYRYILCEPCSQFDLLPLTYLQTERASAAAPSELSPRAFVRAIYAARFDPLVRSGEIPGAAERSGAVCSAVDMREARRALLAAVPRGGASGDSALWHALRDAAAAAARSANAIPARSRAVWTANWIEMRAAAAVGSPAVGAWLGCWDAWVDELGPGCS